MGRFFGCLMCYDLSVFAGIDIPLEQRGQNQIYWKKLFGPIDISVGILYY